MNNSFQLFVVLTLISACSESDNPPSRNGGSGAPEIAPPPAAPATGTPSQSDGTSCSDTAPCPYYYCLCEDRALVNSSFCYQNSCQSAAAHCPNACATFGHGRWTGVAERGSEPVSPPTPDAGSVIDFDSGTPEAPPTECNPYDCPSASCSCVDGFLSSVQECYNNVCQDQEGACPSACADHGGWAGY